MEISCRKLMLMLFVASFTVIFTVVLPLHWMRSTTADADDVEPPYNSVSLHDLLTNVYGENDHIFAVQPAARHSNATAPREVRRVKNREEKREEGLARARSSIRKVALGDDRSNLTPPSTSHNDGYIPAGAVYHNPRLFYQYILFHFFPSVP
ncbi:hypothetical protein TSUD_305800 [Trifolium subterraneum]|uniref:Uncharacterized protein n=1 Tax=Trifolium subterraneum TaxID=3900 RepID=A0A2Z6MCA8_TRISU|nr:hypothetical protein TSUD_305800 [Trifolium subterraneum]